MRLDEMSNMNAASVQEANCRSAAKHGATEGWRRIDERANIANRN